MTGFITKVINIAIITVLIAFVGFVSTLFFIGSQEMYERQLETLPSSFARRALGGSFIGLVGSAILVLVNYIVFKVSKSKTPISLKKLFWLTFFLTTSASIVGTIIFFSHW